MLPRRGARYSIDGTKRPPRPLGWRSKYYVRSAHRTFGGEPTVLVVVSVIKLLLLQFGFDLVKPQRNALTNPVHACNK